MICEAISNWYQYCFSFQGSYRRQFCWHCSWIAIWIQSSVSEQSKGGITEESATGFDVCVSFVCGDEFAGSTDNLKRKDRQTDNAVRQPGQPGLSQARL